MTRQPSCQQSSLRPIYPQVLPLPRFIWTWEPSLSGASQRYPTIRTKGGRKSPQLPFGDMSPVGSEVQKVPRMEHPQDPATVWSPKSKMSLSLSGVSY